MSAITNHRDDQEQIREARLAWDLPVPTEVKFIGQKHWQKFLDVDIGKDVPFPKALVSSLWQPEPGVSGKRVFQTHMVITLSRIFTKQDGSQKALNLNSYGELIAPKFETLGGYASFWHEARREHGNKGLREERCFILIKMDQTLEVTEYVDLSHKEKTLEIYNEKIGAKTQMSKALPTIVAFTMKYFEEGEYPSFHVSCKEMTESFHLAVGVSSSNGIFIYDSNYPGVLPSRKFLAIQ